MSWSVQVLGTPTGVQKCLTDYGDRLSGDSKTEYAAALPHMLAIVGMNRQDDPRCLIDVDANGHSTFSRQSGLLVAGNCTVKISLLYRTLALDPPPVAVTAASVNEEKPAVADAKSPAAPAVEAPNLAAPLGPQG